MPVPTTSRAATPAAVPHRESAPTGPAGRRPGPSRPRHPPRRPPTSPSELLRAFARLYLEVECGRRPAAQLAGLMDPVLHARLESVWVRLHAPLGSVRAVHVMAAGRRHVDAVVVVQRGRRAGALALRLSRIGTRWRVTEAVRPEDGPLPPAPFTMPCEADEDGDDLPVPVAPPPGHERYLAPASGGG